MSRFYLKFIVPGLLFFAVPMLAIRAQPYDDQEVREIFAPDNCAMPCFIGIRPGVTTVEEAISLLQNSDWVDHVVRQPGEVRWFWNGREPSFLSVSAAPSFTSLIVSGSDTQVVGAINIPTRLPAGFIVLLQKPASYRADPSNRLPSVTSAHYLFFSVWFDTFTVSAALECPTRLDNFWTESVDVFMLGNQALYQYWPQWNRQNLHRIMYRELGCRS